MGVLDQITQMKSEGKEDSEIIKELKNKGVSPQEIQDAMNRAQIKRAVSGEQTQDMEKSIMENPPKNEQEEYVPSPVSTPQTQQTYNPQPSYPQQTAPQENYSQGYSQEQYPQYSEQDYSQYPQENYGYSSGSDSGTLIEIAEQVFNDKIRKIQKQVEDLLEFKTLAHTKIVSIEERLKRIENTINQLQISILDKVGSYGNSLDSIKKEMSMMQDSFGKVMSKK